MMKNPWQSPIEMLRVLFPGSFPEIPVKPETRQDKPAGALLSTEEAAEYLAISPETLRRMCRRKTITFVQITPSEYRFSKEDLNEYVASRKNKRTSAIRCV